jgi:uncharacterized repeat protein (TIGR01451 family)
MKKYISVLLLLASLSVNTQAQSYVQGDLNVMPQPMMSHDSTTCSSTCNLLYAIMISNSFVGDTVKIKDQSTGYLITSDVNLSGANPWYVYLPVPIYNQVAGDDQVTGGTVNFVGPTVKVICGPDTVYNINNFYFFPVSNPCAYGSVSGRVYIDNNLNCIYDAGDVGLGMPIDYTEVLNSPSLVAASSLGYSDAAGLFNLNILETWMVSYTVHVPLMYQMVFPSNACSPISSGGYTFTTLPQANVDFALQCSSAVDVQCYATAAGVVRPGVPFYLYPFVSNTGCDTASGQLRLVLDNRVIYNPALSSVPAPVISGDTLTWSYGPLTNLTGGGYWNSLMASLHLTPNTTVTNGDQLCFRIYTGVPAADVDPTSNDYSFCLPVVNSYDPNFKEVSPVGVGTNGGIDPISDTTFTYTIHFQNTGNAPALNITVRDTLDSDLIQDSFTILGASHNVSPQWEAPNVIAFNFFNINLADSTSNEPASHGMVSFRIKRQNSLPAGTQIKNTAYIYFDFNPPVVTNTAVNTILGSAAADEIIQKDNSVKVFPNPFSNETTFMIRSDLTDNLYSFELKDVLGKTVRSIQTTEKEFSISRAGLDNGMYFYNITNAEGVIGKGKVIIK